jgi:pyruvate/2-oxoglutarate/acetoin dehydrogenase E1 component
LSEIETEVYKGSLMKSSKLLAVEEGDPYAGFSAQVISELHEDKFNDFSASIVGYSGIIPASAPCEDNLLISKNDIIRKVKEMVNE